MSLRPITACTRNRLLTWTYRLLTIKGAPEILINRCEHFIDDRGVSHQLDTATRDRIEFTKNGWSARGRRVLLLAHKPLSAKALKSSPPSSQFESEVFEEAKSGLTLVGLVAIVDPPRPEIPRVVATLREAGIRIFMVSPLPPPFFSLARGPFCLLA